MTFLSPQQFLVNRADWINRLCDWFWLGLPCGKELNERIKASDAYEWMAANAKSHRFNPYTREGWHWEYNAGDPYERRGTPRSIDDRKTAKTYRCVAKAKDCGHVKTCMK